MNSGKGGTNGWGVYSTSGWEGMLKWLTARDVLEGVS
jgi:hypothetical protein